MEKAGSVDHSIVVAAIIVSGVAVSLLVSGLMVDILSIFYCVFVVQCVKLMLRIFVFVVSLFERFVYRQNITLKRLPGMGIAQVRCKTIIGRLAVVPKLLCQKSQRLVAV